MKAAIEVSSRQEAEMIRAGLEDQTTRAVVVVMGALTPLSERARERVLNFVLDRLDEQNGKPPRGGQ